MKKNLFDKSRRNDKIAEFLIRAGGMLVIVAVVWILVMIARVAMPLFYSPEADLAASFSLQPQFKESRILCIGIGESQKKLFVLDEDGVFHFIDAQTGNVTESVKSPEIPAGAAKLASVEASGKSSYNLLWDTGAVTSAKVVFTPVRNPDGSTVVTHELASGDVSFPANGTAFKTMARMNEDQGGIRVDQISPKNFQITWLNVEKDIQGNEKRTTSVARISEEIRGLATTAILDSKGHYFYMGTDSGNLLRFDLSEPGSARLLENVSLNSDKSPVTALNLVMGDITVVAGDGKGRQSAWFPVTAAGAGEDKRLARIHQLTTHKGAVTSIFASPRDKTVVSSDEQGAIHVDHVTSERNLLVLKSDKKITRLALSARGNTLCALDEAGNVKIWKLDIPHPDVSLGTLFGKVWYEGYDKPEYVWQSSAANDDFEPKMSLVPLIFGTLKATVFAMLFAVPLALLGALYTSQFMSPGLKGRIKPAVEIMAAIPSVVVGFLAGLWLAPLIDKSIFSFFLSLAGIPLLLLATILLLKLVKPSSPLERAIRGKEFLILIPVVIVSIWLSHMAGAMIEAQLFAGDFKQWLFSTLGIRYDQRNTLIIGIALGFAVIPIIFTIAEDALSNVPRNLSAASLALGASRWQTAWRVVLPSALPGVFSAVMIGFGRAVGETMIVLMATGNTPIISWSAFNGLRSLAANIAVEIPEAPLHSSLYRVLFLSAVLLFIFTFIINSAAEALRQRFRKKYGRY